MIDPARTLLGRDQPMRVAGSHAVLGTPMTARLPDGLERLVVAGATPATTAPAA